MTITNEVLYNKLVSVEELLLKVAENKMMDDIREVSLHKAATLLKLGTATVLDLISSGKLPARKYKDKSFKIRFRIRLADIIAFQQREIKQAPHAQIRTSKEICNEIFSNNNNK